MSDGRPEQPQEIQRDIERTRTELGETVEALAQKADVKSQVQQRVAERRERVTTTASQVRERASNATPEDARKAAAQVAHRAEEQPLPAIGIALALGLLVGWLLARREH